MTRAKTIAALAFGVACLSTIGQPRAAEPMPQLTKTNDYVHQCDDEPGGVCSAAEQAAVSRNVQRAWNEATDKARRACAGERDERGMFICLEAH